MGMLNRIVTMTKAAANEVLDKLENPKLLMGQYLRDMDQQLAEIDQSILNRKTEQRITESKLAQQQEQIEFYEKQAEQAIIQGNEVGARLALQAKVAYEHDYERLQSTLPLLTQAIVELELRKEGLQDDKARLHEKRKELDQRLEKVKFVEQVNAYKNNSIINHFDRIEKSIIELEARQEVAGYGKYGFNESLHSFVQPNTNYNSNQATNEKVEEQLQRLIQKQAVKTVDQQAEKSSEETL